MRPETCAPIALILLLVLCIPLFADVSEFSVPVSTVNQLITVNSTIDFTHILPNYEHRGAMTVSWNVPASTISSVTAREIPVYVLITSDESSPVYFKQDGKNAKEARVILTCNVENGACSPSSNLTKEIDVLVAAQQEVDTSATIRVNSSLSPLWNDQLPYLSGIQDDVAMTTLKNTSATLMDFASNAGRITNFTLNMSGVPLNQTSAVVASTSNLILDAFNLRATIEQNLLPLIFLAIIIGVLGGAYFFRTRN